MSNSKRGRPKGSGIDDSDVLNRIAELILANSSLKPTTAIKKLGIYDDSIIRRLREKWKLSKGELLSVATAKAAMHRSRPKPSQYVRGLGEVTKPIGLSLSEAVGPFGGYSVGLQA
ncbi:MAG: hypothetical protein GXP04_06750, partial [Alphaproteobacteria bacterium]|nr:hypothetical protein [Alphaproteobacteria bacterium]